MSNTASFDRDEIQSIFGEYPHCMWPNCRNRGEDVHHTCKRRPPKGLDKSVMGSPYNASILCRKHHASGLKHRPNFQRILLHKTREVVRKAMKLGYNTDEDDKLFLTYFGCET